MKKRMIITASSIFFLVIAGSIGFGLFHNTNSESTETAENMKEKSTALKQKKTETAESAKQGAQDTDKKKKRISELLNNMTLEEKVGQLFVIGFPGTDVDEHVKTMIEDYHVGGIILFDRNMDTPEQVTTLNQDMQKLAEQSEQEIPLIISVDQEGGEIVRMRDHVSSIPSQQELGINDDEEKVYSTAKQTGNELADMGFNVNYAPVLDLSADDTRSFGQDPDQAYQFGEQVIHGLDQSSITGALKHFPGNGRAEIDPHVDSSSVDSEKDDLENSDIAPFKKMIENVDQEKYMMMVTHLIYPAYDDENPASVSSAIMTELLREQLGFDGVITTDDLEMSAVSNLYDYDELGYRSIKAGADMLLVGHTKESQEEMYQGVLDAIENEDLSEEDVNDSVERVLQLKLED